MLDVVKPLWILWLALLLAGCGNPAPWRQESYVFGTRVEVVIVGAPEAKASAAGNRVLREFDRLHRAYHAWQPSELSALNASIAAGRTHQVSPELATLIADAQGLAAQGEHLFDPGIGRLISLWGFQTDEIKEHMPEPAALAAVITKSPSIAALKLDGLQVTSGNAAVALDFGGYLKGVALDRAAASLKQDGIRHALINIGGNILALGNRDGRDNDPAAAPWRIGIQHPRPQLVGGAPLGTLELRDGEAVGTSGDYHRYFESGGKRYSHLLDPRSGYPAQGSQAVTVLIAPAADAGMRSDALSKPIFIAGADWRRLAKVVGVDAVLKVGADGTALVTPTMRARLKVDLPDIKLQVVE